MSNFTGNKYEATRNLTVKEIAKLIRKDVKENIQSGLLPKIKVSVTTESFAGGSVINLRVKKAPFNPFNEDYVKSHIENPYGTRHGIERFTQEAKDVLHKLEDIVNQYNYDNSDLMTDYFERGFYESIEYDYEFSINCWDNWA